MRLPGSRLAALALLPVVVACGGSGGGRPQDGWAAGPATGPQADYPMVLGAPFAIDGITYTPADRLNYDQVGQATAGTLGGTAVSLAHRELPVPSYVEVTHLRTGKTILARIERRGPMAGSALVELSPGAAAQLSVDGWGAPVRVRRVNPPEAERALLRSGQHAPERMDTPASLLTVLLRRLEPVTAAPVVAAAGPTAAQSRATAEPSGAPPEPAPKVTPAAQSAVAVPATNAGQIVVQVGAFSSAARAVQVAARVGGQVSPAGALYRVRIGRFADRTTAQAALAKARAAGYTDARIQRAD